MCLVKESTNVTSNNSDYIKEDLNFSPIFVDASS